MISAFAIGARVWLVATQGVAEDRVPATLPLGSLVLTPNEAARFAAQVMDAANAATRRQES